MTPSQLHSHLLLKYTTMAMTYNSVLMLIKYINNRVCLNLNVPLHGARVTMIEHSPAIRMHYNCNDTRLCADIDVD